MYRILNLGGPLSCALALTAICGPSSALAQTSAAQTPAKNDLTFPSSLEPTVLVDWLKRETNIPPSAVVAISPLAVVAIMQTKPMTSPEGFEVTVQAETVDAGFSRQEGLASWDATMKLACKDHTFSMGEVTAHTGRNLKGETRSIQTALAGWNPVTPGTMQGQIWSARCSGDFKTPLTQPPKPTPPPAAPPAATPQLKPAITAPPSASPPPPAPKPAPATPVAKPPAAKAPASPAKSTGPSRPASAQILSAPSSDEAARALTRLKSRLGGEMSGLATAVVPVLADGKPRYRAIVSGFRNPAEAMAFCEKVTAAGGKCLARGDLGRAASEKAP